MFTDKEIEQIKNRGIDLHEIERQLELFKGGAKYTKLVKPAIEGDGIVVYSEKKQKQYEEFFENNLKDLKVGNFIPASGAATRMFKDLIYFQEFFDKDIHQFQKFVKDHKVPSLSDFFRKIKFFAFYKDLKKHLKAKGVKLKDLKGNDKYVTIANAILNEDGLNFKNKPKGLIPFHFYISKYRTPVSEHMVEAARFASGKDRIVKIHFTISEEHLFEFQKLVEQKRKKYESDFNVKYDVSFSFQSKSTDTIALGVDNQLHREKGELLFRPGGHGSLLGNLKGMKEDLVFIKNIDNVVPDFMKEQTLKYRKMLAGILLNLDNVVRGYESRITSGDYTPQSVSFIEDFLKSKLFYVFNQDYSKLDLDSKAQYLHQILRRPLRVCGMVKNVGAPGGGPYWVENSSGELSLQIVESSQVDFSDIEQAKIFKEATHFNPVDIVCTFKDWTGKAMELENFVDHETSFISVKNRKGVDIKILERPGLWNGSMAKWNTVFVEVPLITFNPVKSVNDLLNPEHQSLTVVQTTA